MTKHMIGIDPDRTGARARSGRSPSVRNLEHRQCWLSNVAIIRKLIRVTLFVSLCRSSAHFKSGNVHHAYIVVAKVMKIVTWSK